MTRSELFSVMTVGMATVAGSVLVGYALLGVPLDYLLAATFMTAPSGLLMAKMVVPETEDATLTDSPPRDPEPEPEEVPAGNPGHDRREDGADAQPLRRDPDTGELVREDPLDAEPPLAAGEEGHHPINIFDAAARGAEEGLRIAATVGALLIAFISLIALLNIILGAGGDLVGLEDLTFQKLLGYAFAPVAFIIGVPWSEAVTAGSFLGEKLILNEFVAFTDFGSFAILLGGLAQIAPKRRGSVARLGVRAVLAGTLANLLNAAVAGMFV
jgi:concentrative nucleoside transporter, CNT family